MGFVNYPTDKFSVDTLLDMMGLGDCPWDIVNGGIRLLPKHPLVIHPDTYDKKLGNYIPLRITQVMGDLHITQTLRTTGYLEYVQGDLTIESTLLNQFPCLYKIDGSGYFDCPLKALSPLMHVGKDLHMHQYMYEVSSVTHVGGKVRLGEKLEFDNLASYLKYRLKESKGEIESPLTRYVQGKEELSWDGLKVLDSTLDHEGWHQPDTMDILTKEEAMIRYELHAELFYVEERDPFTGGETLDENMDEEGEEHA